MKGGLLFSDGTTSTKIQHLTVLFTHTLLPQVYFLQQLCALLALTVFTRWAGQSGVVAQVSGLHTFRSRLWGQQPASSSSSYVSPSSSSWLLVSMSVAGQVGRHSRKGANQN